MFPWCDHVKSLWISLHSLDDPLSESLWITFNPCRFRFITFNHYKSIFSSHEKSLWSFFHHHEFPNEFDTTHPLAGWTTWMTSVALRCCPRKRGIAAGQRRPRRRGRGRRRQAQRSNQLDSYVGTGNFRLTSMDSMGVILFLICLMAFVARY